MKVILRENVEKLGRVGDVVKVANGYGRNFLIPNGMAIVSTPGVEKMMLMEKQSKLKKEEKKVNEIKTFAETFAGKSFTISRKVGEEEKLFGSVTTSDIAEAMALEGIEIDKRKIVLDKPLQELGIFKTKIKLHPDVETEIDVWVVKE